MEMKYKKPKSKSGKFTVHLPTDIDDDISLICRIKDIPITKYVYETLKKTASEDFAKLKEAVKQYE